MLGNGRLFNNLMESRFVPYVNWKKLRLGLNINF